MALHNSPEFWSITFDFVGKMCLGIMALLVHHKVRKEKKIDWSVIKEMKIEYMLGITSLIFFILSYLIELTA